jgi:type II secretory pathway component GspD/PulD (secretin)
MPSPRLLFLCILAICGQGHLLAQQRTQTIIGPDGKPMTMTSPAMPAAGAKPGAATENKKDGKDGAKPGGAEDADKKKSESPEPKVIRRGDRELGDADPEELKATVGSDGKVAFQFRNQPWVGLVQWLAQISNQPLDWQELPADRVNLQSPGRYSVAQTKDLFNRHLLARGYTLLEMPGRITVAKTEGINPAMVPRVGNDELQNMMPHTFVRTSLDLGWLSSEKMAEELKPMISSNGRLTALTTTNRIEAMDAAINLRQVAGLLEQERNQSSREALAPEFRLRHIPAEKAKEMLEQFLGVEKKSSVPMTPQQIQMMQQMQQRSGGKPAPEPKKEEISIVADTRQNSVFIRAPVDRIAIATEFIHRIDVPGQGLSSLSDIETRVQVFRLASIDPEKLIEIIGEMNVLEPATRLRADKTNNALIVSGSAADRYIIDRMIKRLDGSGREFEVLQLRRLDAGEVAESISFLMGKEKDDENQSGSRRYSYYGYGYGRGDEEDKNKDEFRVAANSRFRQVLLWANESEMEQVRNLLIKLGELPPPGGSTRTVRRIDASSGPETFEYLLRLKQQWEQLSDAPLELPASTEFVDPIAIDTDEEDEEVTDDETTAVDALETTGVTPPPIGLASAATTQADRNGSVLTTAPSDERSAGSPPADSETGDSETGDSETGATIRSAQDFDRFFGSRGGDLADDAGRQSEGRSQSSDDRTPIKIQLDEDGNLLLLGSNTKALDRLENLMLQVAPPKRPYHVFKIKHRSAGYVRLNLVEYFEDTEEDDSEGDGFYRYIFGMDSSSDDGPKGLEKSNELRFVYDPDTNTIVVTGATSSQLQTISELIKLWDVAEPVNKRRMRYTKLVDIEFGQAEKIAETVKEAYRDLLSSNDKTFAASGKGGGGGGGGGPGKGGEAKASGREKQGSGLVDSENGRDGGDVDFSFKGKLSMGVDPVGNTLLVSAEGEPLLDLVVEMIHKLDLAAKPAGDMQIISLSGNTSEDSIENILKAFGGKGSERPKPSNNRQRGPRDDE